MALNIKDAETDRLARQLAAATGESITEATRRAIEERLTRVKVAQDSPAIKEGLLELMARGRQAKRLDDRTDDEILGYDHHGLPT